MVVEFEPSTVQNYNTLMCTVSISPTLLEAYGRLLEAVDSLQNCHLSLMNGGSEFLWTLRELICTHDPRAIAIVETHISDSRAEEVFHSIGFDGCRRMEAQGFAGGIWLFWRTAEVLVMPICLHPQHVTVEIKRRGEEPWIFSAIYGSPNVASRFCGEIWRTLPKLITARGSWRKILMPLDQLWKDPPTREALNNSLTWDLLDLDLRGHVGVILLQEPKPGSIEHYVMKIDVLDFPTPLCSTSQPITRTTCPFLSECMAFPTMLILSAVWLLHDKFKDFVSFSWDGTVSLPQSLATLTPKLQRWKKDVFDNIFKRKRICWRRLEGVQRHLDSSLTNGLIKLEKKLRRELYDILEQEQILWWQKSRANLLIDGDRNTRFFHVSTLIRRKSNKIPALKNPGGEWVDSAADLQGMALE
ncbi:LOW QUALITY PROTEIN: hypothetical protein V2J09_014579 [Rumex salicifolius]